MGMEAIFLRGNAEHDKAVKIITTLGNLIKRSVPTFDVDDSLKGFDMIMQGFLLKVAIADGKLANEELAYIKAVCDKADILETFCKSTNLDVSWVSLKWMDEETRKKLILIIEDVVNKATEKFVVPFALVDVILDRDILEDIKDAFLGIMAAFSMMDGDSDNFSERIAIVQSLNVIERAWKKAMAEAGNNNSSPKSSPSTSATAPQHNSLKARYESLKKN